jgi:hypothetical protein
MGSCRPFLLLRSESETWPASPVKIAGTQKARKAAATNAKLNSKNPATLKGGATKIKFYDAAGGQRYKVKFKEPARDAGGTKKRKN